MKILRMLKVLSVALAGAMAMTGTENAEAQKVRIGYDVVPIHLAPLDLSAWTRMCSPNKGTKYEPDLIRFRGSSLQLAGAGGWRVGHRRAGHSRPWLRGS